LKDGEEVDAVMLAGRLFHAHATVTAVQKARSNSRWRHTFSRSISMQSALDILWWCAIQIYVSSSSREVIGRRWCWAGFAERSGVDRNRTVVDAVIPCLMT